MCPFRWIKFQCWLVNNPQTISSGLVWKQGAPNPWVDYHVPDQNEHKLGEYHPIHRVPPHTHPNDSDSDYLVGGLEHGYYFPFHIWENPSHWLSYLFKMVKTTNQLLVIYWVIYPSGFPWDPHLLMILLNFDADFYHGNIPTPEIPKGPEISQRSPRDLPEISRTSFTWILPRTWISRELGRWHLRGFGMVLFEHRMRI